MSIDNIKNQIRLILSQTDGIELENISTYNRFAANWDKIIKVFKTPGRNKAYELISASNPELIDGRELSEISDKEMNKLIKRVEIETHIHHWTIEQIQVQTQAVPVKSRHIQSAHIIRILGIYGLDDALETGKYFDNLVENIQGIFRKPEVKNLNESCLTVVPVWGPMEGAIGLQVNELETRDFAGILCHTADCRLCAIEVVY